ncbi:MAG: hypothetical protein LBS52_09490 [Dysgonamonadaceae bacterium]|nr:hypothetical protein [Dysgonamonadaceae bacterium]
MKYTNIPDKMYFYGNALTEKDQAIYVPRSILLSLRFGVEKFFWYEFAGNEHSPFDKENSISCEQKRSK